MPVLPTLPQRVAPTLHDDQGAAAIARLLSRSRGAPTLVRLVANLPREECDSHREALRAEGIDMIHLGDSLRWFRDHR